MGIRGRLVASHFFLTFVVVLVIGVVLAGQVRVYVLRAATATLTTQATQVAEVLDKRTIDRVGLAGPTVFTRLVSRLTAADVLVVDADGRVVIVSERVGRLVGTVIRAEAVERTLRTGEVASQTYHDPLGRLSVIVTAPLGPVDRPEGAVVLVRPVGEVTRATGGVVAIALGTLVLGLTLALALGFLLASRFTRPLADLEKAAARVAAGDFSQRLSVKTDDEIGRVAASFNAMAARLGELERERQELYASVSHELRTPVTSIKGFAQALEDNVGGPEERRRYLRIIQEETLRLERLVTDLFQLARLGSRQLSFDWQVLDLVPLVAAAVEKYAQQAQKAEVHLQYEGPSAGPVGGSPAGSPAGTGPRLLVRADGDRLSQVMANLIENALRFTPPGGRVRVSVSGPVEDQPTGRRSALVSVADTGPGIPDKDVGRVFERFYTVERSRSRRSGGTGLGLAIAREIVEAHGGRIWASRAPEGGALFSFTVPLVSEGSSLGGGARG